MKLCRASANPSLLKRMKCWVRILIVLCVCFSIYQNAKGRIWGDDVSGKVMVLYGRKDFWSEKTPGFFSEFFNVLGALKYAKDHDAIALRVVFESQLYSEPTMTSSNYWSYFFDPVMPLKEISLDNGKNRVDVVNYVINHNYVDTHPSNETILKHSIQEKNVQVEEVHFNKYLAWYGKTFGFGNIIYGKHKATYPRTYGLSRKETNSLLREHVRIRPHIALKLSSFQRQHNLRINPLHSIPTSSHQRRALSATHPPNLSAEDMLQQQGDDTTTTTSFATPEKGNSSLCIAVHYRGTDTALHYPYYKVPYEKFFDETIKIMDQFKQEWGPTSEDFLNLKIFVATDELEFLEQMKAKWPADKVLYYEQSPRMTTLDPNGNTLEHTQAIHMSKSINNYIKGESVLMDSLLMASCIHIIKGRSNVSDASTVINPDAGFTFILE